MGRWLLTALSLAFMAAMAGCQSGAKQLSPYGHDLDAICHSEQRSGALTKPEGQRPMIVAQWLGGRIQTEQGRAFLGKLGRTPAHEKGALLTAEARRLGLADCPLASTWPATSPPSR